MDYMENNDDDYIHFDIDNCKFSDSDDDYIHFDIENCGPDRESFEERIRRQFQGKNGELTPYDPATRDERFPLLAWRKNWERTHGKSVNESSGSYNGQRLTFKQIIKYERMHGRIIPDDALKELLRRKRIFPTNDHTYSRSVLTTIARNRAELNDIIQRQNGVNASSRNAAQSPQRPTVPDRTYAPKKGISRASMELLKGDDIAYNGEKKEESKTMRKGHLIRLTESDLHRIVKESVNRILSENVKNK